MTRQLSGLTRAENVAGLRGSKRSKRSRTVARNRLINRGIATIATVATVYARAIARDLYVADDRAIMRLPRP